MCVGDFESWLRDAEHFEAACPQRLVPAIHKAKPQPTERTASARPQHAAEPARPRYAYASGGGGGRAPLMLGIGH